uniref:Uncharacterized protein n=1 Tax=Arundo donax TaxID=35708 RepID=A0A0A8Y650_ARUDO
MYPCSAKGCMWSSCDFFLKKRTRPKGRDIEGIAPRLRKDLERWILPTRYRFSDRSMTRGTHSKGPFL